MATVLDRDISITAESSIGPRREQTENQQNGLGMQEDTRAQLSLEKLMGTARP